MKNLTILNTSIRTLNNLYSLNDLHVASGNDPKNKPANFVRLETTQALVNELKNENCSDLRSSVLVVKNGVGTYACQELVIAYAAWISAAFHLKVIRAFMALNGIGTQSQQLALPEPEPMIQVPMTEKELNQLINVWFLFTRFAESVQHFLNKVRDLLNINLYQHADNDLHRCNKAIQDTKPLIKRLIQLHQKHKNKSTARLHYHGDF